MHSLVRENLQSHLYAYKHPQKENGIEIVFDASVEHEERKALRRSDAEEKLEMAKHRRVAFAVKTNVDYDGALDDESPLREKTVSFKKGQYIHVYGRLSPDWWIGCLVEKGARLGFVPTSRRIGRLTETTDASEEREGKATARIGQSGVWECSPPFFVIPSTRPVIFIGPAFQGSQITQLMHTALRSEIVKRMGGKVKRLTSDIGRKDTWRTLAENLRQRSQTVTDNTERELRLITELAADRSLILLEAPFVNVPSDLNGIHLAPIFVLIRVSDRSILIRLMNRTGIKSKKAELAGVDILRNLPSEQFDVIIEEKGLPEATQRMCRFLEDYWEATHPSVEDM